NAGVRGGEYGEGARQNGCRRQRARRRPGRWVGPATIGTPSRRCSEPEASRRHEEESFNVTVEWAAVARASWRQLSRLVAGSPQFTTMRCCCAESSKERQPACASWLSPIGGGGPESIHTTPPPARPPPSP